MTTRAIKAAKNAYAKVNGVAPQNGSTEEQRMLRALETVWKSEEPYEGESEEGIKTRLSMDSPINGEPGELATYFRNLRPEFFKGDSIWDIIFIMQNELEKKEIPDKLEKVSIDETSVSESQKEKEDRMKEASEVNNLELSSDKKLFNIKKEDTKMGETVLDREAINELEERGAEYLFGEQGVGNLSQPLDNKSTDSLNTAQPESSVTIDALHAAQELVNKKKEERRSASYKSRIDKIILAKPSATEVYVDGAEAKGVCSNPEAALKKFREVTGCVENSETGTVSFTRLPEGEEHIEAAREMLAALKEALADPEKEFPAYISKSAGTVKGYRYTDEHNISHIMKPQKLLEHLIDNTAGFVYINETDQTQVKLKKFDTSKSLSSKKTSVKKDNFTSKNLYSGIVALKVINRQTAIEKNSEFFKEIDPDTILDTVSNGKSDFCVKYKAQPKEGEQKVVVRTYRIPLKVKQYMLGVRDPELEAEFGSANSNTLVDPNVPQTVTAMEEVIGEVLAALAQKGDAQIQLESLKELNTATAKKDEVKAKEAAVDMANIVI